MIIKDLTTLKELFRTIKTPIFGLGVYAFNRLGLENLLADYQILALRYSLDTQSIEKDIKVLALEKGMGTKHIQEPRNATTILKHPKTKKYLQSFDKPALLPYKPSNTMEKICQENNWQLMANPTRFGKELFENKIVFRKILEELGLAVAPGKIISIEKLNYGQLFNRYGLPFVIQHPSRGGGKGTFFINSQEDFEQVLEEIIPPTQVIVSQFIQGPSPSMTGCVTKHGVISTNLQHQILDIPQLYNPEKGSGLFCGHDWTNSRFSEKINQQAYQIVEKIGQYFQKHLYQGIFGLDFVLDEKSEKLYITECNPRLLGSYPVINMAQLLNKEPPILAFHVLEFLKIDYQMDIEKINKLMRQEKIGSQLILHNLTGLWARNHQELKAGIYKLKNNKLEYLRPGYDLKHLKDKEEFLLADGVPFKKSHFSSNRRLCRILTLNKTLEKPKQLTAWAKKITETVYRVFDIRPIKLLKIKRLVSPSSLAKG